MKESDFYVLLRPISYKMFSAFTLQYKLQTIIHTNTHNIIHTNTHNITHSIMLIITQAFNTPTPPASSFDWATFKPFSLLMVGAVGYHFLINHRKHWKTENCCNYTNCKKSPNYQTVPGDYCLIKFRSLPSSSSRQCFNIFPATINVKNCNRMKRWRQSSNSLVGKWLYYRQFMQVNYFSAFKLCQNICMVV